MFPLRAFTPSKKPSGANQLANDPHPERHLRSQRPEWVTRIERGGKGVGVREAARKAAGERGEEKQRARNRAIIGAMAQWEHYDFLIIKCDSQLRQNKKSV